MNWNYQETYFLEFSGRYDGSSRFAEGNRWGWFPSFSGAWRITNEDFVLGTAFNEEKEDEVKSPEEQIIRPENLNKTNLQNFGLAKLKELLDVAMEEEKYEVAAMIRDEIDKRK